MNKTPLIYMRVCGQTYALNNHLEDHVLDGIVKAILKHYPPDADIEFKEELK